MAFPANFFQPHVKKRMVKINKDKKLIGFTRQLAKYTAKILLHFNIKFKNFSNHLRKEYVIEAKRLHPQYSNVQLGIRTGIDRRDIGKYLKSKNEDIPEIHEKDQIVLLRLLEYCQIYKTDRIHKDRGTYSFKQICERTTSGSSTTEAIATELKRRGWIESYKKFYLITTDKINTLSAIEQDNLDLVLEYLEKICFQIEQHTSTLNKHNLKNKIGFLKATEKLSPSIASKIMSVQEYALDQINEIISSGSHEKK